MTALLRIPAFFFLPFLMLTGCQSSFVHDFEKSEHAVSIQMDSLMIQVEVVDEAIVHITKLLQGEQQVSPPDYVTILEAQEVKWRLQEQADRLTISTDSLKVLVHSDGTIAYQDKTGKNFLSETNELSFILPNTKNGHDVSQAFIVGDEALYGLGQYQSGIMNWKNVPMRLQQYNQEIAIPFLLSTKGYGIYWHNYSITDFNQAQNEIAFPPTGQLAISKEAEQNPGAPIEKENVAAYAKVVDQEKNIRETTFVPEKTGQYTFFVEADRGGKMRGEIRLTIDGDPVVNYKTIWVPTCYSGVKELQAGKEYKVVFQNTGSRIDGRVFYNEPDFNKTVFSSQTGDAIDYYFVAGSKPAEALAQYHRLTGTAPLFPKSSYGFWQCRERYHDQEEILENARELRKRNIPVDNIVQDWFYWPKGEKGPEWDRSKYPDPEAMAEELKSLNLQLMVSVWPAIDNKGLIEQYQLDLIGDGNKVDVHDPGVRERFYQMISDSMFHIGVNSIWLDGSEPGGKNSSEVMTAAGPNDQVYNSYSLLVTKAMYEGHRKEFPNERVFNLTRSAYAGQQRYGVASWSGDVQSTWEQLAEQIPAGLNFTMAGVPYWTHDIGGFFRDSKSLNPIFDSQYTNPEFIELLARWFQFGTFSPVFRIHGYVSETEIWRYTPEFEAMARKFIELRYQLLPYIYSEAWKVTKEGHSLMSPLAFYYPEDKNTWEIKDQLFFGESIMVGFVTEYQARSKEIYLPEGDWFDFWTDKKISGGTTINAAAPYDATPMYVRAGAIVPLGPKVQYATQETDEAVTIKVYPGKDAEYVLYFDDNQSYNYENGEYTELIISYSEATKEVQVVKGGGEYLSFEKSPMNFVVNLVGVGKQNVTFKGDKLSVKF